MLPTNMKPHVVAVVFNMETPIDGAEQGQMQVCAKVIVDRRVILHHIVTKRAVALGHRLLLPILPYHPGLHGSDFHNGIQFHETIQSNHWLLPYPSAASVGMQFPVPGYLNTLTKYSACTLLRVDNFTPYIPLSVCSLRCAEIALCPMPWLCFCNCTHHALNDLMKKPAPGSEMRDSR